jgi:hypothetical protein
MKREAEEALLLRQLEERLPQASNRKSPHEVAGLLAEEFVEFGSSGRVYDKRGVIDLLRGEDPVQLAMSDFTARRLAETVVLVTYRSTRHGPADAPAARSLRSSIWKLIEGQWQMVFHQGTPALGSDPAGLTP